MRSVTAVCFQLLWASCVCRTSGNQAVKDTMCDLAPCALAVRQFEDKICECDARPLPLCVCVSVSVPLCVSVPVPLSLHRPSCASRRCCCTTARSRPPRMTRRRSHSGWLSTGQSRGAEGGVCFFCLALPAEKHMLSVSQHRAAAKGPDKCVWKRHLRNMRCQQQTRPQSSTTQQACLRCAALPAVLQL